MTKGKWKKQGVTLSHSLAISGICFLFSLLIVLIFLLLIKRKYLLNLVIQLLIVLGCRRKLVVMGASSPVGSKRTS